jgi:hypothetical protein
VEHGTQIHGIVEVHVNQKCEHDEGDVHRMGGLGERHATALFDTRHFRLWRLFLFWQEANLTSINLIQTTNCTYSHGNVTLEDLEFAHGK